MAVPEGRRTSCGTPVRNVQCRGVHFRNACLKVNSDNVLGSTTYTESRGPCSSHRTWVTFLKGPLGLRQLLTSLDATLTSRYSSALNFDSGMQSSGVLSPEERTQTMGSIRLRGSRDRIRWRPAGPNPAPSKWRPQRVQCPSKWPPEASCSSCPC